MQRKKNEKKVMLTIREVCKDEKKLEDVLIKIMLQQSKPNINNPKGVRD